MQEQLPRARRLKEQNIALAPNLRIGNPEGEALASRDGKLELPTPNSQAGAWELASTKIINLIAVTPERGNEKNFVSSW